MSKKSYTIVMIVINNPLRERKENAMKNNHFMFAAIVAFLFLLTPQPTLNPKRRISIFIHPDLGSAFPGPK